MNTNRKQGCRGGFTLLELTVALVLFGIALMGVLPLFIMQSRQLKALQDRLDPEITYYLAPSSDDWARKLGSQARLSLTPSSPPPAPPVLVMDNGDSGYSESGSGWTSESRSDAFGGTNRYHEQGTGTSKASFLFSGLKPGWYQVWATWSPGSDRATDAPFTILDGSTSRGTVNVRQKSPPKDVTYAGSKWDLLGTFPTAGTTLKVELSDHADGRVIADGVRLVSIRNTITIQSVTGDTVQETVTGQVTMTVVTP